MIHSIDGATLKLLAMAAANAVEREKQNINDLNVFPVPDGDTGTNMSLTLNASGPAIAKLSEDA
ncbi:MAG: DAK2 domain-containing protein, partial [Oscillospiraceae bacterium]|nr:DAK2 domain-containing protein [Oscillospiraceae bacterium]